MNINNYETETISLISEYISSITNSNLIYLESLQDKVSTAVAELNTLARNNPTHATDINKKRDQLITVQKELTEKINNMRKKVISTIRGRIQNIRQGLRQGIRRTHEIGEAPVDYVKSSMGLKTR